MWQYINITPKFSISHLYADIELEHCNKTKGPSLASLWKVITASSHTHTHTKTRLSTSHVVRTRWIRYQPTALWTHLIVNKQLNGVVAPFDEDYLIGLSGNSVREGGSYAGTGAGLEPHAHSEGIHLWQALLDATVQVVGTKREGHLEVLWWLEGIITCWWQQVVRIYS